MNEFWYSTEQYNIVRPASKVKPHEDFSDVSHLFTLEQHYKLIKKKVQSQDVKSKV